MATLFVSDLHLDVSRPAITRLLLDFLARRAPGAEALYILGDLFEAWVGDDDDQELGRKVANGLKTLTERGVPVFLMHGNRDFLLGRSFTAASGATLLPESLVIDLYGTPTLIMHGDTLCTDDVEYQALRARLRAPEWQAQVLTLPLAQRRALARQLRDGSEKAVQSKAETITDVNRDTVIQTMREHGVRRLIHGHTHRPAIHALHVDGEPAHRIVLGDWYERGSVLVCDAVDDCRLETLPRG